MGLRMTPAQLRDGIELYAKSLSHFSCDMGITRVSINRYLAGGRPIPKEIRLRLIEILKERREKIDALVHELERPSPPLFGMSAKSHE